MTQLGEPVKVGDVDAAELECPFDHESPEPPEVENSLVGSGTKLRDRMKAGRSTHTYAALYSVETDPVLNPKDISGHALHQKDGVRPTPVVIPIAVPSEAKNKKREEVIVYQPYPVTCAAHHCIPAQESLKRSNLLDFMISKVDADNLKNGGDTFQQTGKVWCDIGYDVNGTENGVFLPGNYAVGGGRGGLGVWEEADNSDEDEEDDFLGEEPVRDGLPQDRALTGALYEISNQNRKWRYVKEAMAVAGGQFHDRHEDYSDFVLEVLEKIHTNYSAMLKKNVIEEKCGKCKKKRGKYEEIGYPAPHKLAARLNGVSSRLRQMLAGKSWPANVYTSGWVKAYLERLAQANSKKSARRGR